MRKFEKASVGCARGLKGMQQSLAEVYLKVHRGKKAHKSYMNCSSDNSNLVSSELYQRLTLGIPLTAFIPSLSFDSHPPI